MNHSYDQFVGLAGLPRAGGTLLSAILSQNPAIYASGHSPVCEMGWSIYTAYRERCLREFNAHQKDHLLPKIIRSMAHTYYMDAFPVDTSGNPPPVPTRRIVVDRCRSWTNGCNLQMCQSAIDPNIKVIVMTRPLDEVVTSYARLFSKNTMGAALDQVLPQLLQNGSEPVCRAWEGVQWAQHQARSPFVDASNSVPNPYYKTFIFVSYDELVNQPQATLDRIYTHCGWEPFTHDFENVVSKYPEDEKVNGLIGQFVVYPQVARQVYPDTIQLSEEVLKRIREIEPVPETQVETETETETETALVTRVDTETKTDTKTEMDTNIELVPVPELPTPPDSDDETDATPMAEVEPPSPPTTLVLNI